VKTGLFFGSFNPVHIGHMAIANYMAEFTGLKEIWFVVSPQNPLKKKENLLDSYQRLHMVNLAIDDDRRFKVSNIEFSLPQPSYTIDTLVYLQEKYADRKFVPIMGSDSLETIPKWKNYQQILADFEISVYPRPGMDPVLKTLYPAVHFVPAPQMEISSSFIRQSIKAGKDLKFFLPAKVYQYLSEMNFYKK
jgi:nicotinate-nucleotide adenylyltransferase